MNTQFGWHGQALHIDLGTGRWRSEPIERNLLTAYLGGRGLGVRMLRDDFRRDPFDPGIPLVFATGPLCGTPAPASARMAVVSRSPLTGTVFDNSLGGSFPVRLKMTGHDLLLIRGRSDRPVVLHISDEGVEFHPADPLWGESTTATFRRFGDNVGVAAIGPAGENGVRFASIVLSDGNTGGRGGLGAVMGGKNLKAIVVAGRRPTPIAEPGRLGRSVADIMRLFRASPVLFGDLGLREFGTPALVDLTAQRRMTPTDNFRRTFFPGSARYSGPVIRRELEPVQAGCHDCPIRCLKVTAAGERLPEYESLSHFGALNGIDDLAALVAADRTCTELGLDPISAAATLAAWGEIRDRFIRPDELVPILRSIAVKEGAGARLAEGARRLAEAAGRPEAAMTVKSLELPAYDPRGACGLALSYCTANRGGCHHSAYPIAHEILRKPVPTDRFSFAGKGRINKLSEDGHAVVDSLVISRYAVLGASLEEYGEALSAVTGHAFSASDIGRIGERIFLTERCYNLANGFSGQDDMLPERFFSEPGTGGDGVVIGPIDRRLFLEERSKYYRLRGFDDQGGLPEADFLDKQP